jgi:hypothetical protein
MQVTITLLFLNLHILQRILKPATNALEKIFLSEANNDIFFSKDTHK